MSTQSNAQESTTSLQSNAALQKDITEYLPGLAADFDQRWNAAHAELSVLGSSSFSTLNDACDGSNAYNHIKKMGPKIVPLVVDKLAKDSTTTANVWAVLLYSALESDQQYRPSDTEQRADLPLCRVRIVELNCQRNELLANLLATLTELMVINRIESSLSWITCEEVYYEIRKLDQSALTPVMLAYLREGSGPWFYLLHYLAHKEDLKARMFQPLVFKEKWEEFFNSGEQDEAPYYHLSKAERHIYGGERDLEIPLDHNRLPVVNTGEQLRNKK